MRQFPQRLEDQSNFSLNKRTHVDQSSVPLESIQQKAESTGCADTMLTVETIYGNELPPGESPSISKSPSARLVGALSIRRSTGMCQRNGRDFQQSVHPLDLTFSQYPPGRPICITHSTKRSFLLPEGSSTSLYFQPCEKLLNVSNIRDSELRAETLSDSPHIIFWSTLPRRVQY